MVEFFKELGPGRESIIVLFNLKDMENKGAKREVFGMTGDIRNAYLQCIRIYPWVRIIYITYKFPKHGLKNITFNNLTPYQVKYLKEILPDIFNEFDWVEI